MMIAVMLVFACSNQTDQKETADTPHSQTQDHDAHEIDNHNHADHTDCGQTHDGCGGCENNAEVKKNFEEIEWGNDIDTALEKAAETNEILMVDFMATWCPPCQAMDEKTFPNHNIIHKAEHFIPVRIDVDKQQDVANQYNGNAGKYGGIGIPNILFMDKDKNVIRHIVGFHSAEKLASVMDSVLTGKYE